MDTKNMLNPIKTSVFDLFKVGPGPSSSHTIGPMKATFDFLERLKLLPQNDQVLIHSIKVRLYGSLSATGKGHGTDRAVIAGLLGWLPESTNPSSFSALWKNEKEYEIILKYKSIIFHEEDIIYDDVVHDFEFSNTMVISALSSDNEEVYSMEYYSVGGGFIQWKGWKEPELEPPPYSYDSMNELKQVLKTEKISLHRLMLANEMALTGASKEQVYERMESIIDTMCDAVERGLHTEGTLPGFIKLSRKAPVIYKRATSYPNNPDSFLIFLNAYCLSASEENAAGNVVVTAPTSGASGVIPGVLYLLRHHFYYRTKKMVDGMLAAACIGFLVKHNASISGAEAGCMGEVGTASGMAAALLAYTAGFGIEVLEMASEIALEHHLGMTCDPVGGFVQIPCIERNAVGAVKAYNAYLLASSGDPMNQKVTLDQVIKTMRETGRDMSKKYKETSEGGLALNLTEC